jgi:hypothetical protein
MVSSVEQVSALSDTIIYSDERVSELRMMIIYSVG